MPTNAKSFPGEGSLESSPRASTWWRPTRTTTLHVLPVDKPNTPGTLKEDDGLKLADEPMYQCWDLRAVLMTRVPLGACAPWAELSTQQTGAKVAQHLPRARVLPLDLATASSRRRCHLLKTMPRKPGTSTGRRNECISIVERTSFEWAATGYRGRGVVDNNVHKLVSFPHAVEPLPRLPSKLGC